MTPDLRKTIKIHENPSRWSQQHLCTCSYKYVRSYGSYESTVQFTCLHIVDPDMLFILYSYRHLEKTPILCSCIVQWDQQVGLVVVRLYANALRPRPLSPTGCSGECWCPRTLVAWASNFRHCLWALFEGQPARMCVPKGSYRVPTIQSKALRWILLCCWNSMR